MITGKELGSKLFSKMILSGAVIKMSHRDLTSSAPHFFVVLDVDKTTDEAILMCVTTSQIDKVRRRIEGIQASNKTCVFLDALDCPVLRKDCVIDCNEVFTISLKEYQTSRIDMQEVKTKKIVRESSINPDKLKAVLYGVSVSRKVKSKYKKRL